MTLQPVSSMVHKTPREQKNDNDTSKFVNQNHYCFDYIQIVTCHNCCQHNVQGLTDWMILNILSLNTMLTFFQSWHVCGSNFGGIWKGKDKEVLRTGMQLSYFQIS